MTRPAAVRSRRGGTVAYAILIQKGGWELIEHLMDARCAVMLRRAFDEAAVRPDEITFPEGDRAYLEELVRLEPWLWARRNTMRGWRTKDRGPSRRSS